MNRDYPDYVLDEAAQSLARNTPERHCDECGVPEGDDHTLWCYQHLQDLRRQARQNPGGYVYNLLEGES